MLWQDEDQAVTDAARRSAPDLPTTFGETFGAAWSRNQLFGENLTGEQDRLDALGDYLDTIKQKTGTDLAPELDYGTYGGMMPDATALFRQANSKLAEKGLDFEPMSPDQLEQNAVAKRRQADADFAATMSRERGPGATIGAVTGGLAAGLADPINIVALPAAPEEGLGIVANALRWAAIGGGTQAISEAIQAPYQQQVQPGLAEPLENIAEAALFAGGGAAGLRALGDAWSRLKTGAWPTSVRDAGNVVESEANIAGSNIYGGAEGEAAHRAALGKAIDNVLAGLPVDVRDIISPELEAQSRNLMARLEGERAVALPAFDERTIRLMSEEAGLQQQHGELGAAIGALPEGDVSAADRLNRLQAVEAQMQNASPEMRRALQQRRDQILVDTTPEALQEAAAPIARRQELGAQQARISGRLEEIAAERRQIAAQNLSELGPANIGQTMPVRAAPLEAVRTQAQTTAAEADRLRASLGLTEKQPQLPFEQTAAQGEAETANQALVSGVQQIARRSGYAMPAEEASQVAAKILKQSPEEADKTLRDLQMSPRQVAEAKPLERPAEEAPTPVTPIKDPQSPELQAAIRADLDRELVAFHGTEASGPSAASKNPEEAGVFFFTPNEKLAKSYGENVFKKNIDLSNSRTFDVDELVKEPQFQAEMRASIERYARRNPEAAANAESETGQAAIEKRWQTLLDKINNPAERNNDLGHMRFDSAITGAVIARARAEGLDVAVVKNMAEGHGKPSDQILVLNEKAMREPGASEIPGLGSLDAAMKEVDGYHTAAEQIGACAAPAPEEKEAA